MALTYHPETDISEHDRASQTKRVMLYGWDATNLQAVKLNVDSEGSLHVETYKTNDVEEASGTVTYIGSEKSAAGWMVQKIDTTTGTVMRYASVVNNPAVTTYAAAWTARATLTYEIYSEVL